MFRFRKTDELRPNKRTTISGDETYTDMGIGKSSGVGRDAYIAQQRHRRAQANRVAVDFCYRRFWTIQYAVNDAPYTSALDHEWRQVALDLSLQPIEIAARRKRPAGPRQYNHVAVRVVGRFEEYPAKFLMKFIVDAVQGVGSIHHNRQYPTGSSKLECPIPRLIHRYFLLATSCE